MLLLVLVLFSTSLLSPVRAECSPSAAVVAVVSVVSTLVAVALLLLVIYFVLRRRRQKDSYKKTHKVDGPRQRADGDATDGYINAGFNKDDPGLVEEGLIRVENKGPKQGKKKNIAGKQNNTKTWSSFPEREQPGILYRPGSCGSLDENLYPNPEIMTVCLESQDIIGLGFNISGNFGEGIQVSQVHNRGPAVECGKIKVGDKILSVEVSYENIVYEDALTILSYASPYPVKITLQKGDSRRSRDSAVYRKDLSSSAKDEKTTTTQLNHPLYRSQSMDALKYVGKSKDASNPPFQPKRTQSEMKPETRKDGFKIRKKGDRNSKGFVHDVLDKITGTISPSKSSSSHKHEVIESDVVVHHGEDANDSEDNRSPQIARFSTTQALYVSNDKSDPDTDEISQTNSKAARELATLMDDKFDLKHEEHDMATLYSPTSPNFPPHKPERKNKKQDSFEFQNVSLDSSKDTEESNSEIEEDVIVPSSKRSEKPFGDSDIQLEPLDFRPSPTHEKYEDINEALRPLADVQILSVDLQRPPSPDQDSIVEDAIEPSEAKRDSSINFSVLEMSDKQTKAEEKGTNTEFTEETEVAVKTEEKSSAPALDEDMLARLIAMNSYEPGTQGWAGIEAGGVQGGINDDFIPNTKDFVSQPVNNQNSKDNNLSRPMSPPSVAFEVRDDVVRGVPRAVGIKTRQMRESSPSPSTTSGHSVNSSNLRGGRHNSGDSIQVVNKMYSSSNNNNKSNNNNNNSGSFTDEILVRSNDISSHRLVYSGNNPQIDSDNDWKDSKIVDNEKIDSRNCINDLTDSDSEGIESDNPPRLKFGLSSDISNRSKVTENSDISNSFTSSSGEATPPYSSNGQELGSSPEFSLSKSPLELMSGEMKPENKSNPPITLTLQRQDDDGDMEC